MKSILMPRAPKLDKLVALALYVLHVLKVRLEDVTIIFDDGTKVGPDVMDIDTLQDYKALGYGSATERIYKEFPDVDAVPGAKHLVSLCNYNNSTGTLKNKFPQNFFNWINDWPRVGHSSSRHDHLMKGVATLWPVFELYFATAAKVGEATMIQKIRNPFCLEGVQRMLDLLQPTPDQLERYLEMIEAIEQGFDRIDAADQRTNDAANRLQPELTFVVDTAVNGQSMPGAVFRTDDTRMARRLWSRHQDLGIIVIRSRAGNYAIFCRGVQDLSRLHAELESREPGRWHYETRYKSPFLANGSESRKAQPSSLTPSEMADLINRFVTYTTRSQAVA